MSPLRVPSGRRTRRGAWASQQQSQGIEQVTQAIQQMEKVTQTTAATAEESAAASEELNAQAETSMAVVARLEAMVGVRNATVREAGRRRAGRVVHAEEQFEEQRRAA